MLQFLANGLCNGAVIAVVSLGFGLVYTTARVFNLAFGGIFVLASYITLVAVVDWHLPLFAGVCLGLAVATMSGVAMGWGVYQPLAKRAASTMVVLISSIGLQIVLENLLAIAFANQTRFLSAGAYRTVALGTVTLSTVQIAQLVVGIASALLIWVFLTKSRAGNLCRAVADDETLAMVLGVNVWRVRLLAFGLGSALVGAGGILILLDVGMEAHLGFPAVLLAAVACIVGGLRKFLAPVAGGLLLGVAQSLVVWKTSAKWDEAVTFAFLILFLLVRREGIFGEQRRAEEA